MNYRIEQDIESVLEITGLSMENLADELGVSRITISNWLNNKNTISEKHMEEFYKYTFKKGIRLNKIKEQFYREDIVKEKELLLFHGAKTEIQGNLSLKYNKKINDFGNGFYCGESLEQSAMFVATQKNSSLYMLKFNPENLISKRFSVDRDWMLTIAYFRGRLEEYKDSEIVKALQKSIENIDYIVAPIADNRMFEIIDNFIDGEITDVQCQHCLSATNLGMQYVFVSEKALEQITLLEKCYLTDAEKEAYLDSRQESFRMNMDKVKLARKQYRNQGEYIEDILS
jgi:transcriptional regulator with XRE-family HTH domain